MENEDWSHRKCVNSCPFNAADDSSLIASDNSSDDFNSYDSQNLPKIQNIGSPIPYTFRINIPSRTSEARNVTCPPFYLQLDHAIAVIWQLFDPEKDKNSVLGISQLQWALYFLKAIKDPTEGIRSPDIELAIRAIEDALLECYADMASIVMRSPPPQGIPCIVCSLERNIPKSQCQVCTSASWGLIGRPRKSGLREKVKLISHFPYAQTFSSLPAESVVIQPQTDFQLNHEIEQLKNLALSLSASKPGDFKRKKVRVQPNFYELT